MPASILVVDDQSSGRYIKSRALRKAGYRVSETGTAADALAYLAQHAVDLAVLDVKLPDMHGFELCRLVKERYAATLVLQTSATFTAAEDRTAGLEYGADAYLVEPMEETELLATVRALLRISQAEKDRADTQLQFAEFARASPDVLWVYNAFDGKFVFVSAAFDEVFKRSREDLLKEGAFWHAHVYPGDKPRVREAIDNALSGKTETIEYRIEWPNGEQRWLRDTIFPLPGATVRIGGLARDITEAKSGDRQRELLIAELNHRVKNVLAIVQSLVSQTRRSAGSPADFETNVTARIAALSLAHDLLTQTNWEGVTLSDLAAETLKPFADQKGPGRISIEGPKVRISSNVAVTLSLAFHELATNATKYGSLSTSSGRVALTWAMERDCIAILWREAGGPQVSEPKRNGFGSLLINRALSFEAKAKAQLTFAPSGVECRILLPRSEHVTIDYPRA